MSNAVVRTIVENIMNDKFDTLKEDLSKAVSTKAVNVLESKKAMVGKNFFGNKKNMVNEAWYTTKPHAKGHEVVSVNNKQNPYKHKVGDIVSKGEHTQRQYSSDGSAYSEK